MHSFYFILYHNSSVVVFVLIISFVVLFFFAGNAALVHLNFFLIFAFYLLCFSRVVLFSLLSYRIHIALHFYLLRVQFRSWNRLLPRNFLQNIRGNCRKKMIRFVLCRLNLPAGIQSSERC